MGDINPFVSNEPTNGGEGGGMGQSAINAMVASLIPGWGGPICKVDGVVTGCRLALGVLASGAGALVNGGTNTTARMVIYQGKPVLATYQATYDGYQGFMPVTASYTGNGSYSAINPLTGPPTLHPIHDTNIAALNGVGGNSEGFLARSPGLLKRTKPGSGLLFAILRLQFRRSVPNRCTEIIFGNQRAHCLQVSSHLSPKRLPASRDRMTVDANVRRP